MHIKINKKALATPLSRAASLAGSATGGVPILGEVLITAYGKDLTIIGGNGETYIRSFISDCETFEPGVTCIPAKKLQEIISKMGDVIEIKSSDNTQTQIISGKSKITLSGQEWDLYPTLPDNDGEAVSVMGGDFKNAVKKTAFAVSENASTPVLGGIKLTYTGELNFVACDRHRLAQTTVQVNSFSSKVFTTIIKGKSLSDLEKMIDETEEIELTFGDAYFFCKTASFTFYSRIIDGNYPDTSKLIPQTFTTETKINTNDFRMALERALVVAKGEKTRIVSLSITESESVLNAATEGDTAIEVLDVETTGDAIKLSFNAEYAIQSLKAIAETNCYLRFVGPMNPFIIRGEGNINDIQLVLPYRTR